MAARSLTDRILAVGPHVRYVAIRDGPQLHLTAREGLQGASSADSDRYEELLVNPTLLTLTTERGSIDCGGLEYVIVGYGNFRQLVVPTDTGHVSVALEKDAVSVAGMDDILHAITAAIQES